MVNIQQTNIRAGLDVLIPSPPNIELPSLDEKTLHWVYPVSAEFMAQEPVAFRTAATSINAANVVMQDDGGGGSAALIFDVGNPQPVATQGRFYTTVSVILAGAATTPITLQYTIQYIDAAGVAQAYPVIQVSATNPGTQLPHAIYVPPTAVLRVRNATQGGVGDTIQFNMSGFTHPAGTPVSMLPATNLVSL